MWGILLAVGIAFCAIQCMRVSHLLLCAVWLAGASALLSVMLALLGAAEVAVIELSVGAGLVTVLFVFAIGIAGEPNQALPALVPKPLAWGLAILLVGVLAWLILLIPLEVAPAGGPPLFEVMWEQRKLDVWMQLVFLFVGVLGILGLLAEAKLPVLNPHGQAQQGASLPTPEPVVHPAPLTLFDKELP